MMIETGDLQREFSFRRCCFFFIQMYVQSTAVVCFNCPNRGQSKKVLLRQPYLILFICITHCTPVLPIFSTSATSNGGSSIFSFDLFSLLKLETCLCLTHTSLLLIRQIFNARPWLWSKCSPTCNLLWSLHVLSSQALCGNKVILWCWSKVRYSWMMEFVHLEVFCCHLIIYPFLLFTKAFRWCCLLSVFLFNSIIEKKNSLRVYKNLQVVKCWQEDRTEDWFVLVFKYLQINVNFKNLSVKSATK